MNFAARDETLKELHRQNDDLLKMKKKKEIQRLQAENEKLRKEIECDARKKEIQRLQAENEKLRKEIGCDARHRTEPQEIASPMLNTYKECDLLPPATMSQRWSTHRQSDSRHIIETQEPSIQRRINQTPTYIKVSQLDQRMTKFENMLEEVLE